MFFSSYTEDTCSLILTPNDVVFDRLLPTNSTGPTETVGLRRTLRGMAKTTMIFMVPSFESQFLSPALATPTPPEMSRAVSQSAINSSVPFARLTFLTAERHSSNYSSFSGKHLNKHKPRLHDLNVCRWFLWSSFWTYVCSLQSYAFLYVEPFQLATRNISFCPDQAGLCFDILCDRLFPHRSPPLLVRYPGLPEICAYGFRNPFRCGFDRGTDELYCGDVGHTLIESIDIIE